MIAFIDAHRATYGVEPICRVLPIAPSTYHAHAAKRTDQGKSTGSITDACSNRSAISRRPRPKRATMPRPTIARWQRDSNQTASDKPGAVHMRIVLIDGDALTNLMVRYDVGVRLARAVEIKRIDLGYFEDAEPE